MNAAAYSVAVADVTTVLMITLRKQTGVLGASLSAQSPKNRMPPALDRASDSLRYDPSLSHKFHVACTNTYLHIIKRSTSFLIRDVGIACRDAILLTAVNIVGSTA